MSLSASLVGGQAVVETNVSPAFIAINGLRIVLL